MTPVTVKPADSSPGGDEVDTSGLTRLSLRWVLLDTYQENVAYLHQDCALYRAEGFKALSKVEIRSNGHTILATLNVVDDENIVVRHEIGLSKDAFAQMQGKEGDTATVSLAEPPASIRALHRKLAGERLDAADFTAIVRNIGVHRYSKIEQTAFVGGVQPRRTGPRGSVLPDPGHGGVWQTPELARNAGGTDCGCARHAVPQNLVARNHLVRRNRGHHGGVGETALPLAVTLSILAAP